MDAATSQILTEYVPGPGYLDEVLFSRTDLNADGDFDDAGESRYHLTDFQHSTVGLLDPAGGVLERYGYDPFGVTSFHDAGGTSIGAASAVGNQRLFTGQTYLADLGLYDFRHRAYDTTLGRFLSTDPLGRFGDPGNLGNPYTKHHCQPTTRSLCRQGL